MHVHTHTQNKKKGNGKQHIYKIQEIIGQRDEFGPCGQSLM